MRRRKFILGIGSAGASGSALLGAGAFSRTESHRGVSVQVAEDSTAYLGMNGCPDSPNQSYTTVSEHGHLTVDITPDNPTDEGGLGVNSNSRTWFDSVFQVCNQGKESICVYIADDEDWPTYTENGDEERRVEFYLEDDRENSVISQDNAFPLEVGTCACIGLRATTKELEEGDQLLEEIGNSITIVADSGTECDVIECPELTGSYECTIYNEQNGEYQRIGTSFEVENTGSSTIADIAIANDPGEWEPDQAIDAFGSTSIVADASFPTRALLFWDPVDEDCLDIVDAQTWGEYKDDEGIDDLNDWYEEFGTGDPPDDIPDDPDDDLVVRVEDIPEEGVEDPVGPDEIIEDEDWPEMSDDAADEGWITCEQAGE